MKKVTVEKIEYYTQRFMYDLGIKNNDLKIYAVLYSFTIGERGLFHGSASYLAEGLGISVRTIRRVYNNLFKLGLIEKYTTEDGRYSGIRCTSLAKVEERRKAEERKRAEAQQKFAEELSARIEESKTPSPDVKESTEEYLKHIDDLTANMLKKARNNSVSVSRHNPTAAKTVHSELNPGTKEGEYSERYSDKTNNACVPGISINEEIPRKILSENMSEHEKNTFLMMQKYEKRGDNRKFLAFGKSGGVIMTEPQYRRLLGLLPTEELMPYLVKLETMLNDNVKTGRKPPHSHYKTLKKWIEEDTAL